MGYNSHTLILVPKNAVCLHNLYKLQDTEPTGQWWLPEGIEVTTSDRGHYQRSINRTPQPEPEVTICNNSM